MRLRGSLIALRVSDMTPGHSTETKMELDHRNEWTSLATSICFEDYRAQMDLVGTSSNCR